MAAITASMVAELRGKTDAPMMECKKALTEADGDMAKAEELLRVKLGSKAGKASSRVTAEGVVASFISGNTGALSLTVGDAETAVGSLIVTGSSSNLSLVPNGNIVIGGSGAVNGDITARSVSIEPGGELNGAMNIVRSQPTKPLNPEA